METMIPAPIVGNKNGFSAHEMRWRIHSSNLLAEILNCKGTGILHKPLGIFGQLLAEVGERAAELNDPKLNALMCRLTIYTCADPHSPDHDPEKLAEVWRAEEEAENSQFQAGEASPAKPGSTS